MDAVDLLDRLVRSVNASSIFAATPIETKLVMFCTRGISRRIAYKQDQIRALFTPMARLHSEPRTASKTLGEGFSAAILAPCVGMIHIRFDEFTLSPAQFEDQHARPQIKTAA